MRCFNHEVVRPVYAVLYQKKVSRLQARSEGWDNGRFDSEHHEMLDPWFPGISPLIGPSFPSLTLDGGGREQSPFVHLLD